MPQHTGSFYWVFSTLALIATVVIAVALLLPGDRRQLATAEIV